MIIPNEESFGLEWVMLLIEDDDRPREIHIVPLNDCGEHDFLHTCLCRPTQDEDNTIWIHNSYDGREAFETGERKIS